MAALAVIERVPCPAFDVFDIGELAKQIWRTPNADPIAFTLADMAAMLTAFAPRYPVGLAREAEFMLSTASVSGVTQVTDALHIALQTPEYVQRDPATEALIAIQGIPLHVFFRLLVQWSDAMVLSTQQAKNDLQNYHNEMADYNQYWDDSFLLQFVSTVTALFHVKPYLLAYPSKCILLEMCLAFAPKFDPSWKMATVWAIALANRHTLAAKYIGDLFPLVLTQTHRTYALKSLSSANLFAVRPPDYIFSLHMRCEAPTELLRWIVIRLYHESAFNRGELLRAIEFAGTSIAFALKLAPVDDELSAQFMFLTPGALRDLLKIRGLRKNLPVMRAISGRILEHVKPERYVSTIIQEGGDLIGVLRSALDMEDIDISPNAVLMVLRALIDGRANPDDAILIAYFVSETAKLSNDVFEKIVNRVIGFGTEVAVHFHALLNMWNFNTMRGALLFMGIFDRIISNAGKSSTATADTLRDCNVWANSPAVGSLPSMDDRTRLGETLRSLARAIGGRLGRLETKLTSEISIRKIWNVVWHVTDKWGRQEAKTDAQVDAIVDPFGMILSMATEVICTAGNLDARTQRLSLMLSGLDFDGPCLLFALSHERLSFFDRMRIAANIFWADRFLKLTAKTPPTKEEVRELILTHREMLRQHLGNGLLLPPILFPATTTILNELMYVTVYATKVGVGEVLVLVVPHTTTFEAAADCVRFFRQRSLFMSANPSWTSKLHAVLITIGEHASGSTTRISSELDKKTLGECCASGDSLVFF